MRPYSDEGLATGATDSSLIGSSRGALSCEERVRINTTIATINNTTHSAPMTMAAMSAAPTLLFDESMAPNGAEDDDDDDDDDEGDDDDETKNVVVAAVAGGRSSIVVVVSIF